MPDDRRTGPRRTDRLLQFAGYFVAQVRYRALTALIFLLLGGVTDGLSVLMLVPILRLVSRSGDEAPTVHLPSLEIGGVTTPAVTVTLLPMLAALVLVIAARAVFTRYTTVYKARLLVEFVDALRVRLCDSLARARWRFLGGTRAADYQHVLTAEVDRVGRGAFLFLSLVQGGVLTAVYVVVSWFVSPVMTGFAFGTGVAVLLLLRPLRRRAAQLGVEISAVGQTYYRSLSEFLGGMKTAKSFGAEQRYVAEVAGMMSAMRDRNVQYTKLSSVSALLFQIVGAVALCAFVYIALVRLAVPVPELLVLILIFSRLAPLFPQLQRDVQQILMDLPAFEATLRMLRESDAAREPAGEAGRPVPALARAIRFEEVRFRYAAEQEEDTLKAVSFEIPAGRITCLIGPSGSGKSTIADLLLGLVEPDGGRITIDGVPLDDASRRRWRDQVAYVPQDVFLLHDSIAANLRLGDEGAPEARLWSALAAAHADTFVRALPRGLETVVGERGTRLSGGERQRIALARALLRRPRLLVLDEATSALDWQSQAAIARSIEALRGEMTIVTIAHRLSMIAFADWVVALEGGAVVETGEYAEMAALDGGSLARLVAGERATAAPAPGA